MLSNVNLYGVAMDQHIYIHIHFWGLLIYELFLKRFSKKNKIESRFYITQLIEAFPLPHLFYYHRLFLSKYTRKSNHIL